MKLQFKKAIQGSFKAFIYSWTIILILFCIGMFVYPLIFWNFDYNWLQLEILKDLIKGINACIILISLMIFFIDLFWEYIP